jgi:glutathione S-transferase
MITLYHTPLSPACRKIRLMMREKTIPHQLVLEEPWNRRMEFFAMNPAGEVPVLVNDKGHAICGAYAIAEYLDETHPDVQFFGNTPLERAEVRRLVEWFDSKFDREVTQLVLFEKLFKRQMGYGEPSSEAIRAGKKNIGYHLDYIAHLLLGRNWLAGEYLTLADISAAAHLSCLDYLGDVSWEQHPSVKEWYALIKCRPAFRELLEDRVQGFKPATHYTDPDF